MKSETGGVSTAGTFAPRSAALTAATTAGSGVLLGVAVTRETLAGASLATAALARSTRLIRASTDDTDTRATITAAETATGASAALRRGLNRALLIGFSTRRKLTIDSRNAPSKSSKFTLTSS